MEVLSGKHKFNGHMRNATTTHNPPIRVFHRQAPRVLSVEYLPVERGTCGYQSRVVIHEFALNNQVTSKEPGARLSCLGNSSVAGWRIPNARSRPPLLFAGCPSKR